MFSWIIDIILGGLPGWIWPAIAGGGFAVYSFASIIGHFPAFKAYTLFIKPIGIALCVGGIFMWGGSGVTAVWQAQIAEMQKKVDAAEQASANANKDLEAERIKKAKVRTEYITTVKERIVEKEKQIDAGCRLDSEVPKILNDAARNPLKVTK